MLPNILLDTKLGAVGNGLFLNKKHPYLNHSFLCIFAPGVTPICEISGQKMTSVIPGSHPDYEGNIHPENTPVIDSNGLLTYGPYENLISHPEDISDEDWVKRGSCIVTALEDGWFRVSGLNGIGNDLFQSILTDSPGSKVSPRMELRNVVGDNLQVQNPKGNSTGIWKLDCDYFRGSEGRVLDKNSVGISEVVQEFISYTDNITGFHFLSNTGASFDIRFPQLTETPCPMPYVPSDKLVPVDGVNLVTDGDTESALPTMNDVSLDSILATYELSTELSYDGSNAIKVIKTTTEMYGATRFVNATAFGLDNGAIYETSVWVYLPSGQAVSSLRLRWRDGANIAYTLDSTTTTDQWVKLTGIIRNQAWAGLSSDRVLWISAIGDDVIGEFWFIDDLSIVELTTTSSVVLRNYSTADEGNKFQIKPDEIGSEYTGPVVGENKFITPPDNISDGYSNPLEDNITWVRDGTQTGWGSVAYNNHLTIGATYEVSWEILSIEAGAIGVKFGQVFAETTFAFGNVPVGEIIQTGLCTVDRSLAIASNADFKGAVRVNYVKEVSRNMGMPDVIDSLDGTADGADVTPNSAISDWSNTEFGISQPDDGTTVIDGEWIHFTGTVGTGSSPMLSKDITEFGKRYECIAEVEPIVGDIKFVSQWGTIVHRASAPGIVKFRFTAAGDQFGVMRYTATGVPYPEFRVKMVSLKEISNAKGEMLVEWMPMFDWEDLPVSKSFNITSVREEVNDIIYGRRNSNGTGAISLHDNDNVIQTSLDYQANTKYLIKPIWGMHPDDTLSADKWSNDHTFGANLTKNSDKNYTVNTTGSDGANVVVFVADIINETDVVVDVTIAGNASQIAVYDGSSYVEQGILGIGTHQIVGGKIYDVNKIYMRFDMAGATVAINSIKKTNQPKMQLIVDEADGPGHWESSIVDFDGSFNPGPHFSIGHGNFYPQYTKIAKINKEPITWLQDIS